MLGLADVVVVVLVVFSCPIVEGKQLDDGTSTTLNQTQLDGIYRCGVDHCRR